MIVGLKLTSSTKWVGVNPTRVPFLETAYFAATSLFFFFFSSVAPEVKYVA